MALTYLTVAARADNGPVQVQVFQSGKEGYHTFRIPAVILTGRGTGVQPGPAGEESCP